MESLEGADNWVDHLRQWHAVNLAAVNEPRDLTPEETVLLGDLSSYYHVEGSFPLRFLTEDPSALAACGLFPNFPADKIGILSSFSPTFCFAYSHMFMAGLNIIVMAASSWQSRLVERLKMSEMVAAGENAQKSSSKRSAPPPTVTSSEDILPSPANPGKKVVGSKRKDPSGPPIVPKRPRGSSSNPSQPISRVALPSSQKGKAIQEGAPLLLTGPPLSDQLGKSALNLSGEACAAVFRSLSNKEVTDNLKKEDSSSLTSVISENLMQVLFLVIILLFLLLFFFLSFASLLMMFFFLLYFFILCFLFFYDL